MTEYRAYILGIDGQRFIRVEDFLSNYADDIAAMQAAEKLVDKHDVELWECGRLVARFDHEHGGPVSIVPTQAEVGNVTDRCIVPAGTESKELA